MIATPAPSFYALDSLHVAIYDAMHANVPGGDDLGFYRELAEQSGGPALELGVGTGRLAIPLAEGGNEIVGIDRSAPMLRVAEAKRRAMSPAARRRLRLVEGDITGFRLGRRFGLVFAAFRVFMSLLDPAAQRACLAAARRHLRQDGLLAIDVFDPLLDRVTPGIHPPEERGEFEHPASGGRVRVTVMRRETDPVSQLLIERWRFAERGLDGQVLQEEFEELRLRWTYRQELRHLLELSRFEPLAEYSDYAKSAPAYGREQIWVARRA